ncbi:PREDICTED: LOW QUALITY PROTEIN: prostaglandin E synthase [Chinchilla lanigera]|uniref:LOW QUALITY PROTEIN: prostaglandin E synthase n=1 Tax=Chinchilla lanigera TaxID=34839 RepID=UPI00038EF200|nr:PREDICTED: LOW QUALITY PROTEIN: prostaglandin E synthase [Chinchilla lanigera]
MGLRATVKHAQPPRVPGLAMVDSPVLPAFLLCSMLPLIKTYMVAVITGQVRLWNKAFTNPEDTLRLGGPQFYQSDPDVEPCLRAHRNNTETIYPFLFLSLVYCFLLVLQGCLMHSVAYLGKLCVPLRSLAYIVAQLPCASMALQILWEAAHHLCDSKPRDCKPGRTALLPWHALGLVE